MSAFSSSAPLWVTSYFCPALGVLICNVMWLSPMSAITKARKEKHLGDINVMPFVITIINCIGWTIYSFILRDYFLFFANATGLVLGWYYTLHALYLLGLEKESHHSKQLETVEGLIIFGVTYWCIACLVAFIILGPSPAERNIAGLIIGISSIVAALSYYAAPLSTIYEVVRNFDSVSLYKPLIVTNLINALMWVVYGGISLQDPLVYIPNGIGFVFALVQLIISIVIPRRLPVVDGEKNILNSTIPSRLNDDELDEEKFSASVANDSEQANGNGSEESVPHTTRTPNLLTLLGD